MGYLNLSILLGEVVNFIENIFNIYNFNNSIIINISNLAIRIWIIKIKLN